MSTRIGMIVPSSNTVAEVDFYRRLPPDCTLHTARMYLEETTPEGEAVRERLYREILSQAPWCTALDTGERRCLLGLMRKMLRSRGGR